MAILPFVGTVAAAAVFTEVVGYFLHILLHSEKVAWLSRNHMIHHLKAYGPRGALRQPGPYKNSVDGRPALGGIGFEWLLPTALVLAAVLGAFHALRVPLLHQAVFTAAALTWGRLVFGIMHDSMHLEGYWMAENRLLGGWYKGIRRLHDIHHLEFSEDGRMLKNYGICFFAFDRLFGSYLDKAHPFNEAGYQAALKRYAALIS